MSNKTNNDKKILDLILAFNSAIRYEDLLNIIIENMIEITSSDAGTLYIVEKDELHFRIIINRSLGIFQSADDKINLPPVKLNENNIQNVSAYAAIKNEFVIVDDVYESERFNFSGPKDYDKIMGYKTQSMLVLPLSTYRNDELEVLGVIQLLNAKDDQDNIIPYRDNTAMIPALANVAASTLSNLIHLQDIRKVFHSFVSAMVRTIDERSKYNSNHTHKVAALCDAFARYLNTIFPKGHSYYFDEKRLEELSMAAMLHDIGKIVTPIHIMDKADRLGERLPIVRINFEIKFYQLENDMLKGLCHNEEYLAQKDYLKDALELIESTNNADFLPDEIVKEIQKLSKLTYRSHMGAKTPLLSPADIEALCVRRGTLTDSERKLMQEHTSATGRILSNIAFGKYYKNVTEWAQNHHELLDGTGYPRGLAEGELATEVLIITIMDIFEALTAGDRPYKKAMSTEEAFSILYDMADSGKLHKELVELFKNSRTYCLSPKILL